MQHLVKRVLVAVAVFAALQLLQHRVQHFVFLTPFHRVVAFGLDGFHLFHGVAEDKDILFAHLLGDFDVRPVQRADGQRAVQRQLHVAGTGGFFSCG